LNFSGIALAETPDGFVHPHPMTLRRLLIAFALIAAVPVAAQAQIYVWRDAAGNLVLSDKQKDPAAQTYSVRAAGAPAAVEFRTTKPVSRRAMPFETMIEENAAVHGVSPHLVRAVIQQESGFNPRAVSHKGAMGLMQLMPATATEYGVNDPYNPSENIRAGVAYLKGLLVRFQDNVELALAAYNAGPTAVTKYGAIPPYRETRNYVSRITSTIEAAPKPKKIYRTYEMVNGRAVPKYSTIETPGAELIATAPTKR
jgi:soluble lytic murein transglycosylase-like protein